MKTDYERYGEMFFDIKLLHNIRLRKITLIVLQTPAFDFPFKLIKIESGLWE